MAKAQPPTPLSYHELLQAFRVVRGMPSPKSSSGGSSSYDEDTAMTIYARDHSGLRLAISLIPWSVDRALPLQNALSSSVWSLLGAMEECMMDAVIWTWVRFIVPVQAPIFFVLITSNSHHSQLL
jgi:hypothetical protein